MIPPPPLVLLRFHIFSTFPTPYHFPIGGFSDYFSRPSYQDTVVSSYFSSIGSANEGLYNTSGRAVPDIAAQGENIPIITNGRQVSTHLFLTIFGPSSSAIYIVFLGLRAGHISVKSDFCERNQFS